MPGYYLIICLLTDLDWIGAYLKRHPLRMLGIKEISLIPELILTKTD